MNRKLVRRLRLLSATALGIMLLPNAHADENLFGYVKGSEVLPKGALEAYQWFTQRSDKGSGHYEALDTVTELEYGVTNRFQVFAELGGMSIDTNGLVIDGYLPFDKKTGWRPRSVEFGLKYNFLSPAKDDFGLSATTAFEYAWIDKHSGQDKKEYELETQLQVQKYFMEGQLIWVGNIGLRAAWEKRGALDNLPAGFDWPTDPEMEITPIFGTGLSYRFAPSWFIGGELQHETEYETGVSIERRTLFGGPTLHYGGDKWWASLTYFKQLWGSGEKYVGQTDNNLHLIEKTKQEVRVKIGYNF
jgi:hypothetical protein